MQLSPEDKALFQQALFEYIFNRIYGVYPSNQPGILRASFLPQRPIAFDYEFPRYRVVGYGYDDLSKWNTPTIT